MRVGATTVTLFTEHLATPIGRLALLTDEQDRVRALDWDDRAARLDRLLRLHYGIGGSRVVGRPMPSAAWRSLDAYFDGDVRAVDRIAVETAGTPFQRSVWAALRRIPAGRTVSYGELANAIGRPGAARAVGLANGSNPIGIIVPCHRVIGCDSSLIGYGGGLARKRWLLEHEETATTCEKTAADRPWAWSRAHG